MSRGYFTDESTSEMLAKWTHMLCPADRFSSRSSTCILKHCVSQSVRGEEREGGKGSCIERECDREEEEGEEVEGLGLQCSGRVDSIRVIPRSMAAAIRYFSLFLPTTKDIPPEKSWQLWLPLFSDFWQTWGNSPVWEVDLLR